MRLTDNDHSAADASIAGAVSRCHCDSLLGVGTRAAGADSGVLAALGNLHVCVCVCVCVKISFQNLKTKGPCLAPCRICPTMSQKNQSRNTRGFHQLWCIVREGDLLQWIKNTAPKESGYKTTNLLRKNEQIVCTPWGAKRIAFHWIHQSLVPAGSTRAWSPLDPPEPGPRWIHQSLVPTGSTRAWSPLDPPEPGSHWIHQSLVPAGSTRAWSPLGPPEPGPGWIHHSRVPAGSTRAWSPLDPPQPGPRWVHQSLVPAGSTRAWSLLDPP